MMTRLPSVVPGVLLCVAGCVSLDGDEVGGAPDEPPVLRRDLTPSFSLEDLWLGPEWDLGGGCGELNRCGDCEPGCESSTFGPPGGRFPLGTDPQPDPAAIDSGVTRDPNGYLLLESTHPAFNYLWLATPGLVGSVGTVAKVDSKTVREVARYLSYTCYSLRTGSTGQCDGSNGCCSLDDWNRYQARNNKMPEPAHQAVQRTMNSPSRTGVDWNGDLFVANRAFGGQSSVTRIANDFARCVDRNKNGKIDTSSDTNGNGSIETDCNGDGQLDDINSVKGSPCLNGLKQEFYGDDDECVLWTTNTFQKSANGRPLGMAGGSDVWAGSFAFGTFVGIDGTTGKCKADAQLPGACTTGGIGPYGLTVDASGIGWTVSQGIGKLCYFDTRKPASTGVARDPLWGPVDGDGIAMDRDQNVWIGGAVARYVPDRSNGFKNLGNGWWTRAGSMRGLGIAADSRSAKDYFVYSCAGSEVVQIPASSPVWKPMKMDQTIQNPGWPVIRMPCYGVGVDSGQNVWGVDMALSTRALVDKSGAVSQPAVNGQPLGNNKCPRGDSCPNAGAEAYSDFTGFGLRNFTAPSGTFSMVVPGCKDPKTGEQVDTEWITLMWDADVPPNTTLGVQARSSSAASIKDAAWLLAIPTAGLNTSPAQLQGVLVPNLPAGSPKGTHVGDQYLLVDFQFKTMNGSASPRLKAFSASFRCP